MKKRTLSLVPKPAHEYVPPSEMYPNGDTTDVTPSGDMECFRCGGILMPEQSAFVLMTDVRNYVIHHECPEESYE